MLGCARAIACSPDVDSNDALRPHKRACTCIAPGLHKQLQRTDAVYRAAKHGAIGLDSVFSFSFQAFGHNVLRAEILPANMSAGRVSDQDKCPHSPKFSGHPQKHFCAYGAL